MIVDCNPEFGIELTLALPYAYSLHKRGKLEKVITSKGMKPFYYFCDNVEERYEHRTVDNKVANMDSLPNSWIYGSKNNAELYKSEWKDWESFSKVDRGCGILDYSEWEVPDYKTYYKNDKFKFDKPFIVVSNRYNWEHNSKPVGYFSIKCLYDVFNYLTNSGYLVIYKRPNNTEFPLDQNEINTLNNQETLKADVEGVGVITDYELTNYYDDVILFDKILEDNSEFTYNELQLNLFSNAEGFISMSGGSTLLLNLFKKPTITYLYNSSDLRDKFWEDENGVKNVKNYYHMTNPNIIPFIDKNCEKMVENKNNEFLNTIKKTFTGNGVMINKNSKASVVGMTEKEVSKIEKYIKSEDTVLEWGSGGSTLYFPNMVKKYVSIEHDINWYDKIKPDTSWNVDFYHVPIPKDNSKLKLDALLDEHSHFAHLMAGDTQVIDGITYWPTRERYDWHCGIDYIKKPLSLSDDKYDIVIVDGRCRAMCAYLATHILKDDGYLLFHDFVPRKYYHGILKYYEVIDKVDTLAVLSMRDKEKINWVMEDDVIKLSDNLYNNWVKETGRIR
jgi:hypothetical protein